MSSRSVESFGLPPWLSLWKNEYDVSFGTPRGVSLVGASEVLLAEACGKGLEGKVDLIFTSPPFPLLREKSYDNKRGQEYLRWIESFAPLFKRLLSPKGSLVIEIGNAWERGIPVLSTLPMESLLAFKKKGEFHLCQELIWHNPARLPGPTQWVNVERTRLKDTFTRLWWLSNSPHPNANNRRVLQPYSPAMQRLLRTKKYNSGKRPSEHQIGETSFLSENGGAIAPSVLRFEETLIRLPNTHSDREYRRYCERNGLDMHPARMPQALPEFFIQFLTDEGDLVLDPFGGSNTTGAAAEKLGRQWITVELNRGYAESGRARFGLTSTGGREK